uniref:Tudor domain-containing protein n=1 Tax=Panagrellus redivivus TaxID=6233 RepID=A0A7E4UU40_PANRE
MASIGSESSVRGSEYDPNDDIGGKISGVELEERWSEVLAKAQARLERRGEESRVRISRTRNASAKMRIAGVKVVDYRGVLFDKTWTKKQSEALVLKNSLLYHKYYLGAGTSKFAEEAVKVRGGWNLYHATNVSLPEAAVSNSEAIDYPSTGALKIVYRRIDSGAFEHYEIKRRSTGGYYVAYGDPEAPRFETVFGLVYYYDNYAHLNTENFKMEVFPLWAKAVPVPTISEYSVISSEGSSWIPGDSVFDDTIASTVSPSSDSSSFSLSKRQKTFDFTTES